MKSINYIVVRLDEAYGNEVELDSGDKFIVNSTIESVEHINRVAEVVASPDFTIVEKGDKVVVHHNIFRLRNNTKGNEIDSNYYLGDGLYIVPLTEVFMYKRDGDWMAIDPYCFVKPIQHTEEDLWSEVPVYKGRLHKVGVMAYPNRELMEQGVKAGDTIRFSDYSEYEFVIGGELYYKMSTKDVLAVI